MQSLDPSTDVVCDMMCGIGPFAVPAARRGCAVLANDLNPDSYRWLLENVRRNKVSDRVRCYNMDGRAFVRMLVAEHFAPGAAWSTIMLEETNYRVK